MKELSNTFSLIIYKGEVESKKDRGEGLVYCGSFNQVKREAEKIGRWGRLEGREGRMTKERGKSGGWEKR